jgi:hypothetical protein
MSPPFFFKKQEKHEALLSSAGYLAETGLIGMYRVSLHPGTAAAWLPGSNSFFSLRPVGTCPPKPPGMAYCEEKQQNITTYVTSPARNMF